MARRTWVFVLVGAVVGAVSGFLYQRSLTFIPGSCGANGHIVCHPRKTEVFGVVLTQSGAAFWSIVLGSILGALLGALIARLTRRG